VANKPHASSNDLKWFLYDFNKEIQYSIEKRRNLQQCVIKGRKILPYFMIFASDANDWG